MNTNPTYLNSDKRKKTAIVFVVISMFMSLLSIGLGFYEWHIYSQYEPSASFEQLSNEHMDVLSRLTLLIHLPTSGLFIISVIFFLMWIYRIHYNARGMQLEGTIYAPGWSVAFYFIPIVNLVLPLISMIHVYNAHFSSLFTSEQKKQTWLIYVWWITFLFSYFMTNPATFLEEQNTFDVLINDIQSSLLSDAIFIISGFFLIQLIRRLTLLQQSVAEKQGWKQT